MKRNYYGETWWDRFGITTVVLGVVVAIGVGIYFLIGALSGPSCDYPYHTVYTGYHEELVGKVLMNVDQYKCVHN